MEKISDDALAERERDIRRAINADWLTDPETAHSMRQLVSRIARAELTIESMRAAISLLQQELYDIRNQPRQEKRHG